MLLLSLSVLLLTCQCAEATLAANIEAVRSPCTSSELAACPGKQRFASATTLDRIGRIVAPVYVDGRGPFRFVIDTGASRSTVSPALTSKLGLQPSDSPGVWLSGVTGSARVPTVGVRELRAGGIDFLAGNLPVIWSSIMADADGILGIAGLHRHRMFVDFERDHVEISLSDGRRPGYRHVRVRANVVRGGLLAAEARIGAVRTTVVIDTGAERSLGNLKLLEALRKRRRAGPAQALTPVEGATGEITFGHAARAPPISFDNIDFKRVMLTYGDFHIFDVWGLDDRPAILLGMDVLGTVKSIVFDYHLRELHIRV